MLTMARLTYRVEGGTIVDLVPGQVRLGQRGLQQVLGVGAIAGQQQRDPQQRERQGR